MKLTMNKEGKAMQLTKKKVFSAAFAVCLIAICSMGTLAWFSDTDAVTNKFMVAGSENDNPDDIFSVDVWENTPDSDKNQNDYEYKEILPGDELKKEVRVENTGSYDQYVRVKITVTDAKIWQDVYDADMVPITEFVDIDLSKLYGVGSYQEGDNFVYYLYYNDILPYEDDEATEDVIEDVMVVFDHAHIAERLTREQAAKLNGGQFDITIEAEAVQTENVIRNEDPSDDVYEAFNTVEMVNATNDVNTVWVDTLDELLAAFANGGYVVMMNDITMPQEMQRISTTINLYLNEYTLSTGNDLYGLNVTKDGDLTIGGYGNVHVCCQQGILVYGTCSIFGGTYLDDEEQSSRDDESLINVYADGTLNIYNGTFSGVDYCVNVRKDSGTAYIYGGTYSVINANGQTIKY